MRRSRFATSSFVLRGEFFYRRSIKIRVAISRGTNGRESREWISRWRGLDGGTRVVFERIPTSKIPDLQLEDDHDRYSARAKRCHAYTARSRGCARNCSTSRTRVERASTYARVCSSSRASHPTTLIAPYHARTSPPSSLTASYLFTSRASAFGLPCLHVSPLSLLSFTNRLAVSPKANSVKLDPSLRFNSSSSCVYI